MKTTFYKKLNLLKKNYKSMPFLILIIVVLISGNISANVAILYNIR